MSTTRTARGGRAPALLAVIFCAFLGAVVLGLPAAFADPLVATLSHGRVRLVDAQGTWLRGEARVVLLDGSPQALPENGFAIPGLLRWDIKAARLLLGEVAGTLQLPAQPRPVAFGVSVDRLWCEAGRIDLPRAELSALGSPWNTIRPSAALSLAWEALAWQRGEPVPETRLLLELRDVASAMTPVAPLGDYRIEARASTGGAQIELTSLAGSLRLAGSGRWEPRGGLRLQARAWGEGADRARLQSLLGLLGQRQGEETLIRIGG